MATATFTVELRSKIEDIWNIVVDLNEYSWRSDIKEIKVVEEGKQFIEYSTDNIVTTFTITTFMPMQRYEFDIDNKNMHGHWVGEFVELEQGTKLIFTEVVEVKNPIMKLFVKKFLVKQQTQYIEDLKIILGE